MDNENKTEEVKTEANIEDKKKKEKAEDKTKVKKVKMTQAIVRGLGMHISTKDAIHICDMIRGNSIDTAIKKVEEVIAYKRVVRMNNREVPHQHGKGVMGGRWPINASKEILKLLKSLKANAIYHELELEKARLTLCVANKANQPFKRGGARAKRAHVTLKLEEKKEILGKSSSKNEEKRENKKQGKENNQKKNNKEDKK